MTLKLKDTFITCNSGDEYVMVASEGFSGMVRSNKTAAFVIECLKEPVSIGDLTGKMTERFDVSREQAERDIKRLIGRLNEIGAIDGLG